MRRAVFLDKDGTLIPDIPYNSQIDLITLAENAVEGLRLLQHHGYLLVVITNQSGVALGYFQESFLFAVENKIKDLLNHQGIQLDGFYYCPHHPAGNIEKYSMHCSCRKPQPGMLLKAAKELQIDLKQSWMIGDILRDVEAGNKAGCKTILIDNGNEAMCAINEADSPDARVKNINQAAKFILKGAM